MITRNACYIKIAMVSVLTRFYDAEPQVGALQLRFATLYQKPAFIPVYETGHSVSSSKSTLPLRHFPDLYTRCWQ